MRGGGGIVVVGDVDEAEEEGGEVIECGEDGGKG